MHNIERQEVSKWAENYLGNGKSQHVCLAHWNTLSPHFDLRGVGFHYKAKIYKIQETGILKLISIFTFKWHMSSYK